MKNKPQTEDAIRHARGLFEDLIVSLNADDGPAFSRNIERILTATASISETHTFEVETARPDSTKTLAQKVIAQAADATANSISAETARRMRRLGLDPKYAGIRNEGDLIDMRFEEKQKRGS